MVYWYIFTVVETLLNYIDSRSPFFDTFRNLLAQAGYYFKCCAFLLCLILTSVHLLMFTATSDNILHGLGLADYTGAIMVLVGDGQWMPLAHSFGLVFDDKPLVFGFLAMLLVYALQFLLKHVVFSFFFGVVISSTRHLPESTMANRIKAFIFNEETLEQLVAAWMEHDPDGTGLMEASNYIDFVLNLKHPIALNSQDLKKKLKSLSLDLRAIYTNMAPENQEANTRAAGFENPNFITRQTFKENREKSINLTVDQFFVYCRLYNVPIYLQQHKWY